MDILLNAEYQLTVFLNSIVINSSLLVDVVRFFAIAAIFFIVGFVVLNLFVNMPFFSISGRLFFIEALFAGTLSWGVNQLISLIYWRSRPFAALGNNIQALIEMDFVSKSFPSDHAAVAMSLALVTFLWSPRVGIWFVVLAILIGVARFFAGVHYPSDIIVGLAIGGFIGWLVHRFFV